MASKRISSNSKAHDVRHIPIGFAPHICGTIPLGKIVQGTKTQDSHELSPIIPSQAARGESGADTVRLLCLAGGDASKARPDGATALHLAARSGASKTFEQKLESSGTKT